MRGFLFLLLAWPSFSATYFVANAGNDTCTGTSQTIAASGTCAWKTVAKVNASSFVAGDQILFNRGDQWREMLSLPSSGSSGNVITVGAYGTGNNPILNGSDLVTGTWTQTRVTQMSDALNHNGANGVWTVTGTGVTFANSRLQVVLSAVNATHRATYKYTTTPATELWFTYQVFIPSGYTVPDGTEGFLSGLFQNSNGTCIACVGYRSVSGVLNWRGFYGPNGGGSTGTALSGVPVTTDTTHTVLGHLVQAAGSGSFTYWVDGTQISTAINLTNSTVVPDQIQLGENFVGNTVTISGYYTNVAVYSGTDNANVWQTALTTQPNLLAFNSSITGPGGIAAIPASYNSVDENWYWSGNVIYLSSTSIPSSRWTSVEAASRSSAIDTAGKNFVTIDGLSLQKSNGNINGGLTIGTSNHITLQNSESAYNANAGVYIISGAGGSLLLTNNNLHDNADGVLAYQYSGAGSGTELVISFNTIANNNYYTYSSGSFWQFPEGIQIYGNYSIIDHNTVSGNGSTSGDAIAVHIYADSGLTYGNHNIIRYNTISGQISNGTAVSDGSGVELDHYADSNQILFNTIYGNQGPCIDIYAATNTTVANNSCYNNILNSIFLYPGEIITSDSNNLIGATPNNVFKNNVAYATHSAEYAVYVEAVMAGKTNTYTHNILYASGQSNWYFWNASGGNVLGTFNALSGVSANLNADPKYTNPGALNFSLQATSPSRNAGLVIAGYSFPYGAPDLGAIQYYAKPANTLAF